MICPSCGAENAETARICVNCGRSLAPSDSTGATAQSLPDSAASSSMMVSVQYAGFWRRFVAFLIDAIITNIIAFVIGFVAGIGASMDSGRNFIGLIVGWLYWSLQESSRRQATIGKMALGIIVTGVDGMRISWARATARYFSKIISALILLIGFIMAGFTQRKQALHDMIAETLVIRGPSS